MSWYTDPQLFIYSHSKTSFYLYRITKEFSSIPVGPTDFKQEGNLIFSEHLSLGNNKESDFDAFKAAFPFSGNLGKFINSQGLVINWDVGKQVGSWSREEINSPLWSLPGITKQKPVAELLAEIRALAEENSELKTKNTSLQNEVDSNKVEKEAMDKRDFDLQAEISLLKAEIIKERDEKSALINSLKREDMLAGLKALEKQVSDLTSKLVQCCGAAGGGSSVEEPWITGQAVPSNWVPFEDLDVLPFSRNIPLTITKTIGGSKLGDDKTTNVQTNCFHQGRFPIMVVDVAELTPGREEARFDPSIWGSYTHSGISYAARKLFASEMSDDAHKTC